MSIREGTKLIADRLARFTDPNGVRITLWSKDTRESDIIWQDLDFKKPIEIIIRNVRKKRSLTANAYCWVLCDKIAIKIRSTKEEVYRQHIRDVGVFSQMLMRTDAIPEFVRVWESQGLGFFTDIIRIRNPLYREIHAYYGSSKYDTKQMARLIDSLVVDADALGIQTKKKSELDEMYEDWAKSYEGKYGK